MTTVQTTQTFELKASDDIVAVRQAARRLAVSLGFGIVDQTKVVTATSELARNTVDYGGGGVAIVETVRNERTAGVRVTFEDHGPGIADVEQALADGFTSGSGMGLGLGGAKRLSHEFEISSKVGEGTRVSILRWK